MATPRAARPLPTLASGEIPTPGDRVTTFDDHRAEVLWTTPKLVRDHRKDPHELPPDDPHYWSTLVRLADGSTYRYAPSTLRLETA